MIVECKALVVPELRSISGSAGKGARTFEALNVWDSADGLKRRVFFCSESANQIGQSNRPIKSTNQTPTTGSLGFGLARETEIVCGVRKADNSFETMSYTFGAKDMGWEKEVSWASLLCTPYMLIVLFFVCSQTGRVSKW